MKQSTKVFARFTNIGKPDESIDCVEGTLAEVMKEFLPWLVNAYMGKRIEFVLARNREDLEASRGARTGAKQTTEDFMTMFESIVDAASPKEQAKD